MNPERVQLFRIRYVIGRSKTVPGLKTTCYHIPEVGSFLANHGLSKAQLVPSCSYSPPSRRDTIPTIIV